MYQPSIEQCSTNLKTRAANCGPWANPAVPVRNAFAHGSLDALTAKSDGSKNDRLACKARNIYYVALCRKTFAKPCTKVPHHTNSSHL